MSPVAVITSEERLDAFCSAHGYDWGIRCDVDAMSCWSAEVRVTRQPNRADGPDRSLVTYAVAGAEPAEVIEEAVEDMLNWLPSVFTA
jgi:hypothetical protein